MGRKPITDEQIEHIKATFAETGNVRAAARAASCSVATASKYVSDPVRDEFEHIRTEKRVDIIEKIADAQAKLIDAIVDQAHLSKASMQELGTTFGILTDKRLLLTGQATARTETMSVDAPTMRLTPEERERARELRERMIKAST